MAILKSTRDNASVDEAGKVAIATVAEGLLGTNATKVMTPASTKAVIDALIDGAPGTLDTLNELAAAINDDANFVTTVNSSLTNLQNQINSVSGGGATNQIELDNTQAGAGLGTNGAYTAHSGSNFISSVSTLHAADLALDTQIKVNADAISSLGSGNIAAIQAEVDTTQSSVGLSTSGTYVSRSGTNYLDSASSIVTELTALDTQAKANEDAIALLGSGNIAAIQAEVDAIETSVGLNANGSLTYVGTPTLFSASATLKAAIQTLDPLVSANSGDILGNANQIAAQIALNNTQEAAIGLSATGTYVSRSGTNFLDSASTIVGEITALDTQLATTQSDLDTAESTLANKANSSTVTALQSEVDASQAGVGLATSGAHVARSGTNFIDSASSIVGEISLLDAQVKTNEQDITAIETQITSIVSEGDTSEAAIVALQSELDATQAGAGLSGAGSYTAPGVSNYLSGASTLKAADSLLDTQIKTNETAIATKATSSSVSTNTSNIATNTSNIATNTSNVATNTSSISTNTSDISTLNSGKASNSSLTALQSEVDTSQASIGLSTSGAYSSPVGHNFLGEATIKADLGELDGQVKINTDAVALKASSSTVTALQAEVDATQTGAGLGTNGAYTADSSTEYLTSATSLKDADDRLDAQIKTNEDAIATKASSSSVSTLQSELDATQTGAGLNSSGDFVNYNGTNYLDATSTLAGAIAALDGQIKLTQDEVDAEEIARASADSTLTASINTVEASVGLDANGGLTISGTNFINGQSTVVAAVKVLDTNINLIDQIEDNIIASAGLTATGTKTNYSSTNVIANANSLKAAIEALDVQVNTNATDITSLSGGSISALQTEVDAIETAAGLSSSGAYVAHSGSNYMDSASTMKAAREALDTQVKTNEDAVATKANSTTVTAIDLRLTQMELSGGGLWKDESADEVSYEFRLECFRSHIGPFEVKFGGVNGFIMNGAGSGTTDLIMYETVAERDGDRHFHVHPVDGDLIFQGKYS